jgi:hypothetical protein
LIVYFSVTLKNIEIVCQLKPTQHSIKNKKHDNIPLFKPDYHLTVNFFEAKIIFKKILKKEHSLKKAVMPLLF